jgi:hypothetical protein
VSRGDSVDKLVGLSPPCERQDFGTYTILRYFPHLSFNQFNVLAEDGRIVAATGGGCTWQYRFFGDEAEERIIYEAYYDLRREGRQ